MNIGLTSAEAQKRLLEFGQNIIEETRRTPLFLQFLGQFKDLMVVILIAASIFAFFAGETVDASIIFAIVIVNASIGFIQEFKAEQAIEALKKLLAPKARVLRDSQETLVEAKNLVPGDFIILNEGDKVPADSALKEENEIRIDESILTGESVPVPKDTEKNKKIFMGTQVMHGTGRALVTQTGMRTEFGKIALLTSETKKDKSPLQRELAHIGLFVGKITLGISLILFLIGFFVQGRELVETFLFAVSVAVAAVPEGLPATITVALALGVQRLARKNAIVKQLSSVETLGSTTVICSDKTGTLTKNEMTVQEIVLEDYDISVHGVGYQPEGSFTVHAHQDKEAPYFEHTKENLHELAYQKPGFYTNFEHLLRGASLCNNARLTFCESDWKVLGDPTEAALLVAAEKAGFEITHLTQKNKRVFEIPFDSLRKRMSVIAQDTENKKIMAYVKGAPETLLPLCTHMMQHGKITPFTAEKRKAFLERNELLAQRALRTIAVAWKELPQEIHKKFTQEDIEKNLIFGGLMAMMDPPREEVKEAVKLTHKAGIRVFIITGDHGRTAHAVATDLGLAKSYGVNIITGETLEKMSDEKLQRVLAPGQETLFARVNPHHKLRIVEVLKQLGEIVAVTGDGVNDAPALKRADIGVAMGITGTDVSKEAANMVLTDDSFSTIVTAVLEGRTIYENMKKFIFYIFSSNIGELIAIFATISLGLPAPLTAIFILLINTLTDVFPALALGVERVELSVLEKKPRKPSAKIMEWPFIRRYLINGLWIGLATTGVFIWNLQQHGWRFGEKVNTDSSSYFESATMAFVVLTLLQMVHTFNSRSEKISVFRMNFFSNFHLLAAVAFSVLATIAFVQIPFFQGYLKTTPLTFHQWVFLIAVAFSVLLFEEIRKAFTKAKKSMQENS